MKPSPDSHTKAYRPQRQRTFKSALMQRLGAEFPRIGGTRILDLCAEMILEVIDEHLVIKERVKHGQVVWNAIDAADRPHRGQRASDTRTIPVILTLSNTNDLEDRLQKKKNWGEIRLQRAIRLCQEAYEQGGLLSNVDLSLILGLGATSVASMLVDYEKKHNEIVPRRTTLHDMGSGVTHKRIICRKHHLEGKDPTQVAQETWHTMEAVDRYLGQYDRVRHCRQQGMDVAETAHILACGERLVREYLQIDNEINEARETKREPNEQDLS